MCASAKRAYSSICERVARQLPRVQVFEVATARTPAVRTCCWCRCEQTRRDYAMQSDRNRRNQTNLTKHKQVSNASNP